MRCNAAESSLVLWEKEQPEAPCEALREVAGAPIFAREEAEAFPMESECSFYSVGLVLIFERSKFSLENMAYIYILQGLYFSISKNKER